MSSLNAKEVLLQASVTNILLLLAGCAYVYVCAGVHDSYFLLNVCMLSPTTC